MYGLCVQLQYEPCSFGVSAVQRQATVHLGGNQRADGESQPVALRQVFHFGERLEDVFALLLGDTATGVADDELVGVCTAFLEVQPYFSSGRGVFGGVFQQMQ